MAGMEETPVNRRNFLNTAAGAASLGAAAAAMNGKPAVMGGTPVRTAPFPSWPKIDRTEEQAWSDVLRSGKWFRGSGQNAEKFEQAYARLLGAKHCVATANGTSALFTSLNALEVGPGDEVLVPPYTFVATINTVLLQHALPVFVDSHPDTYQMDARKIEAAITDRTAAIMPVHVGGAPADMDAILAIAAKRKLPVIEDACQAHLGEWRGRKLGTLGSTGCFSFQASKNLNSGEGGAVVTNDDALLERCFAFHNNGRGKRVESLNFSYRHNGANLRMTEFQATLLLAQMTRLEEQSRLREQNAAFLTEMLRQIPGIIPAATHEGTTRNAYHLYMFRFKKEQFSELPRESFIKALRAEGIPCSSGYKPLNKEPFLENVLNSRGCRAIYSAKRLSQWRERNQCPVNDQLCQEAIWFTQTMLLDTRQGMEEIAGAIRKIHAHSSALRAMA